MKNQMKKGGRYKGIKWKSDADLSRKLGKCRQYVNQNKKLGKTYKQIIDSVLNFHEYRGIRWKNDSDLSIKLGRCRQYVNTYKRRGDTCEQIIDRCLANKKKRDE